jgi:hypothetical protein
MFAFSTGQKLRANLGDRSLSGNGLHMQFVMLVRFEQSLSLTVPQEYVECLAGYIIITTLLYLIFGRFAVFIDVLGYVALGIESSLPIPQLIRYDRDIFALTPISHRLPVTSK